MLYSLVGYKYLGLEAESYIVYNFVVMPTPSWFQCDPFVENYKTKLIVKMMSEKDLIICVFTDYKKVHKGKKKIQLMIELFKQILFKKKSN